MKHYGIEQWADFSRGLSDLNEQDQMTAHLGSGCENCRRLAEFTKKLHTTCSRLAMQQVPEPAVRLACSIFPARAHAAVPSVGRRGIRLPVELIFDSLLVPAPAGLRASWQVGWQGLYRAGDCSVDLRIEPELATSRAAVIGQITNHVLPEMEMGNLPVRLRSGKVVVAETVSNRFGEFQMEYEQQSRLKLCIDLQDSKHIQVPLKKFIPDQPATKSRTSPRKRTSER